MRMFKNVLAVAVFGLTCAGCTPRATFDGPKVNAFTGQVVQNGQPISFAPDSHATLEVIQTEKAYRFNIPLAENGTFKIGWMPIGKYEVFLNKDMETDTGQGTRRKRPMIIGAGYHLPEPLMIEDGKTEYTIELGKDYKP
jgi:hypothetical protein